jgi:hypothetical protein
MILAVVRIGSAAGARARGTTSVTVIPAVN